MAATADQIKSAQNSIDIFEKAFKGGANDKIKQLVKATGKTAAKDIADAITNAKDITQDDVDKAKKAAEDAKTKLLSTDLNAIKTDIGTALTDIGKLISKIGDANTEAGKITDTGQKTAVTDPLGEASNDANAAQSKLSSIKIDDIVQKTGTDLEAAITAAVKTVGEAQTSTDTAKTKLDDANTEAGKITDAGEKTATENAIKDASTAVATAQKSVGEVATDGTNIEKDYNDYAAKQKTADGMKVETSTIMTVATDACPNIKAKADATEDNVAKCMAEAFKGYGFINAILKNIPYKAKDVLTSTGSTFDGYAADLTKSGNEAKLKAAGAHAQIVATACGTGPFVTGDNIPNPKDEKGKVTTIVGDCLKQTNKIAYAILSSDDCGKDKLDNGAVKAGCYTNLAGNTGVLFDGVDTMKIDLSADYPYDQTYPDMPNLEL